MFSSSKGRARYFEALEILFQELQKQWEECFAPDATWLVEGCEAFFQAFVQFGTRLYDAYAEELLESGPVLEKYLEHLNFDFKTRVCEQIAGSPQKLNGELQNEWTTRMDESWRLIDHGLRNHVHKKVGQQFIYPFVDRPELRGGLIGLLHNALSRRVPHWLAEHANFELARAKSLSKICISSGGIEQANAQSVIDRATRRRACITPILNQRGWKPGRLVTEAGVGKNSVYHYLNGKTKMLSEPNRKAIAEALEIEKGDLPD